MVFQDVTGDVIYLSQAINTEMGHIYTPGKAYQCYNILSTIHCELTRQTLLSTSYNHLSGTQHTEVAPAPCKHLTIPR